MWSIDVQTILHPGSIPNTTIVRATATIFLMTGDTNMCSTKRHADASSNILMSHGIQNVMMEKFSILFTFHTDPGTNALPLRNMRRFLNIAWDMTAKKAHQMTKVNKMSQPQIHHLH